MLPVLLALAHPTPSDALSPAEERTHAALEEPVPEGWPIGRVGDGQALAVDLDGDGIGEVGLGRGHWVRRTTAVSTRSAGRGPSARWPIELVHDGEVFAVGTRRLWTVSVDGCTWRWTPRTVGRHEHAPG